MADDTTALATYSDPIIEAVPTFTDAKAQRRYAKAQEMKVLVDSIRGVLPIVEAVGGVYLVKSQEGQAYSKVCANLLSTAVVAMALMQAVPPEGWVAMASITQAALDKIPTSVGDLIWG